jgi:hypothetical protein
MQVLRLLVLSLSLTAVFFALGIILASLVVVEAGDVRRLYFRDLAGAALGCLLAVPLQATIGPPAMVFVSMVALGALGLIVALATRTGQAQAVYSPPSCWRGPSARHHSMCAPTE